MAKSKYLVGEIWGDFGTFEGAIIFPDFVAHSCVAKLFENVTSGGFVSVSPDEVRVYGNSTSVGVESKSTDVKHVKRALGISDSESWIL